MARRFSRRSCCRGGSIAARLSLATVSISTLGYAVGGYSGERKIYRHHHHLDYTQATTSQRRLNTMGSKLNVVHLPLLLLIHILYLLHLLYPILHFLYIILLFCFYSHTTLRTSDVLSTNCTRGFGNAIILREFLPSYNIAQCD